jgi:hypothetical protein
MFEEECIEDPEETELHLKRLRSIVRKHLPAAGDGLSGRHEEP